MDTRYTERLLLLRCNGAYLDDLVRICAEPAVMRYISGSQPLTCREHGHLGAPPYALGHVWPWTVGRARAEQRSVGRRAGIRLGFERARLERIISVTHPANQAAHRVMEKCGLAYQGLMHFRNVECVWYDIDRPAVATQGA